MSDKFCKDCLHFIDSWPRRCDHPGAAETVLDLVTGIETKHDRSPHTLRSLIELRPGTSDGDVSPIAQVCGPEGAWWTAKT